MPPSPPSHRATGVMFLVVLVWTALQLYAGARILLPFGNAPLAWLGWAVVAMAVLMPAITILSMRRSFGRELPRGFSIVAYIAFGIGSIAFPLALVGDVLSLIAHPTPQHRALAVLAATILAIVFGAIGARVIRTRRVRVPIDALPESLVGYRIVQLSDLHVGLTIGRRLITRAVTRANALGGDVIVVTGDLADGQVEQLRDDIAPVAELRARDGVYFVTGNHDYYWAHDDWMAEADRLGLQRLDGTHRVIRRENATLLLAGIADHSVRSRVGHASPSDAIAGAPEADVRICLAHQPLSAPAVAEAGFDLQLSGHTHGGQYAPYTWLVGLFQPWVAGLHRVGDLWLYVSRGTGYWGPPFRLFAPAEVTLLELVAAESSTNGNR